MAMGQNRMGTFSVGSLTTSLKGFQKGHRGYGVLTAKSTAPKRPPTLPGAEVGHWGRGGFEQRTCGVTWNSKWLKNLPGPWAVVCFSLQVCSNFVVKLEMCFDGL